MLSTLFYLSSPFFLVRRVAPFLPATAAAELRGEVCRSRSSEGRKEGRGGTVEGLLALFGHLFLFVPRAFVLKHETGTWPGAGVVTGVTGGHVFVATPESRCERTTDALRVEVHFLQGNDIGVRTGWH